MISEFRHSILQVIPRLDYGGAERAVTEISAAIVRSGGKSFVATEGGQFSQDIRHSGGEIIPLPVQSKNPITIWRNVEKLSHIIRSHHIDLIHAHSRAPAWSAFWAAKQNNIVFVTSYHGAYKNAGPLKRIYNSSLLRGDCVIANSEFTAKSITETKGYKPKFVEIIPPGAELKIFDPDRTSQDQIFELTSKWGLRHENTRFCILMPARLTSWKGHIIAIEAISLLKNKMTTGKFPLLTLVFCGAAQGRTNYVQYLREKIEQFGVGKMVHIVGECNNMPAAYGWADVVISPSTRPEAFGRVAVEAGAMKKPIIASSHGGALETVIHEKNGLLFEAGNAEALASAIERLMEGNKDILSSMGQKGREIAMRQFSAEAMCAKTLRIYDDLITKRQ